MELKMQIQNPDPYHTVVLHADCRKNSRFRESGSNINYLSWFSLVTINISSNLHILFPYFVPCFTKLFCLSFGIFPILGWFVILLHTRRHPWFWIRTLSESTVEEPPRHHQVSPAFHHTPSCAYSYSYSLFILHPLSPSPPPPSRLTLPPSLSLPSPLPPIKPVITRPEYMGIKAGGQAHS